MVKRIPWTKEEEEFLKENTSTPMGELSLLMGRTPECIRGKFKALGIRRTEKPITKFTDAESSFIINNFKSLSNAELASKLGKTVDGIRSFLRFRKLRRPIEDHSVYFNIPIHPRYAYILGWLFADGYITTKYRRCCLLLEEQDALYLKPFLFDIYPYWRIYRRTEAGGLKIRPQLTFMCKRKSVAGFMCNEWALDKKSLGMSDEFYNYICSGGDECKRCFLRGFFEGDGWISQVHSQSSLQINMGKRADYDWSGIINLMPNDIKTKHSIRHSALGSSSVLSICTTDDAAKFCKYIYNTKFEAALPRKKDRAVAHFKRQKYNKKYGPLMEEV